MTRYGQAGAAHAVGVAIREGRLAPAAGQPCRTCGLAAAVLHHWSYLPADWLDVVPVCHSCHRLIHAGALADPTSGQLWDSPRKGPRLLTPEELSNRELIGNPVRALRKVRGLSQAEAGRRSGMTGSAWGMIENGQRGVSEAVLNRMATALDASVALSLEPAP